MRNIFSVIGLAMLLSIAGCAKCNCPAFSSESMECQRLERFWREPEADNVRMIVFFGEDSNEPIEECPFEEFKEALYQLTGCCFSKPHPLASEWMECNRLECIWEYLEKENIQRIAFYENVMDEDKNKPEDWHSLWAEIVEPERTRETIKLFCKAMKRGKDRFANEGIVLGHYDRMQIMTDKHKFIIPIGCGSRRSKVICGIGWTSYELRKKLAEWGFPRPK